MAGYGNGYPYRGAGPGRAESSNAYHTHNYNSPLLPDNKLPEIAGNEMTRAALNITGRCVAHAVQFNFSNINFECGLRDANVSVLIMCDCGFEARVGKIVRLHHFIHLAY